MSELKPCPFCGNRAMVHSHSLLGKPPIYYVRCDTTKPGWCGALLPEKPEAAGNFETKAEAIAAWNRRAPDTSPTDDEALEAARRIVDAILSAHAKGLVHPLETHGLDALRVATALIASRDADKGSLSPHDETSDEHLTATKWRKKPVVVEAWRFDGSWSSARPIVALSSDLTWIGTSGGEIAINTLEGVMTALPGDWIIKGVKGEFYPCKPDIFAATYEPAQNSTAGYPRSEARNETLEEAARVAQNALVTPWFIGSELGAAATAVRFQQHIAASIRNLKTP